MRKAIAFRGGANKTAPPCFPKAVNSNLVTVPAEQSQRNIILQKSLLLGKTVFHIRQKGCPSLLLPTSVLQLPRCLARIYNLDSHDTTLFEFESFKKCNCSRKTNLKKIICSAMWATRPHLANIFEKLLDQKTFGCLRLALEKPPESDSARLGHIPSLPWESQLPLKPYLSLQPSDFEGNCDSLRFSPRFLLQFHLQV